MRRPAGILPGRADAVAEAFRLRPVAVAAFGPATLFGLAEGAMLPVIALSSIDRGASTAIAALINALLGIGSLRDQHSLGHPRHPHRRTEVDAGGRGGGRGPG